MSAGGIDTTAEVRGGERGGNERSLMLFLLCHDKADHPSPTRLFRVLAHILVR